MAHMSNFPGNLRFVTFHQDELNNISKKFFDLVIWSRLMINNIQLVFLFSSTYHMKGYWMRINSINVNALIFHKSHFQFFLLWHIYFIFNAYLIENMTDHSLMFFVYNEGLWIIILDCPESRLAHKMKWFVEGRMKSFFQDYTSKSKYSWINFFQMCQFESHWKIS